MSLLVWAGMTVLVWDSLDARFDTLRVQKQYCSANLLSPFDNSFHMTFCVAVVGNNLFGSNQTVLWIGCKAGRPGSMGGCGGLALWVTAGVWLYG